MVPFDWPAPKQCSTPSSCFDNCCATTHFGENQLVPSSIGISPLTTTHPPIFQHWSVRTSTKFYLGFFLAMVRSLGFGSVIFDTTPIFDLFSLWLQKFSLTLPKTTSRRLILQQARGHHTIPQIDCFRFQNLFTPRNGVLFHLSLTVLFTISDLRVFSLTRWASLIYKGFHVSQATRVWCISVVKLDFYHLWCRFQLLKIFLKSTYTFFIITIPQP